MKGIVFIHKDCNIINDGNNLEINMSKHKNIEISGVGNYDRQITDVKNINSNMMQKMAIPIK